MQSRLPSAFWFAVPSSRLEIPPAITAAYPLSLPLEEPRPSRRRLLARRVTAGLVLLLLLAALISLRNSADPVREIRSVVDFANPGYGALARSRIRSLEQARLAGQFSGCPTAGEVEKCHVAAM